MGHSLKEYNESAVRYLIESGQVDGDVLGYVRSLEERLKQSEDIISQLDTRITEAQEKLQGD